MFYGIIAFIGMTFITYFPIIITAGLNVLNLTFGWNINLDPQVSILITTQAIFVIPMLVAFIELIRMYIDKWFVNPIKYKIAEYKTMSVTFTVLGTILALLIYHSPTIIFNIVLMFVTDTRKSILIYNGIMNYEGMIARPIVMAIAFVPLLVFIFDWLKNVENHTNLPIL